MKIQAKLRGKQTDIQAFIKAIEDSSLADVIVTSDYVNRDNENFDLHLTFSSTEKNQMYWEFHGLIIIAFIFVVEYITNESQRNFKEISKAYINMARTFIESATPQERLDFVTEKLKVLYDFNRN